LFQKFSGVVIAVIDIVDVAIVVVVVAAVVAGKKKNQSRISGCRGG